MLDTEAELVFSLKEFSRQLKKRRGIDRNYSTIHGWVTHGWSPRGRTEPVIKLESVSIMGARHTSFAAFDRFVQAQNIAMQAAQ